MDREAWLDGEDPGSDEKYAYYLMRDPKMREFTGPKEEEFDQVTGTTATFRHTKVSMVRGGKPENMIPTKVWLAFDGVRCIPHRRIESQKSLQGWYQSGDEGRPGSRVRPCEAEAILTQPYGGSCAVACYFSLPPGETIETPNGPRRIEDIRAGEFVWGRTSDGTVLATVKATSRHWKPEGYLVMGLSDGRVLRLTADHPVYSAARRCWVAAGDLRMGEELEAIRLGGDGKAGQDWQREDDTGAEGSQGRALSADGKEQATCDAGAEGQSSCRHQGTDLRLGGDVQAGQDWSRKEGRSALATEGKTQGGFCQAEYEQGRPGAVEEHVEAGQRSEVCCLEAGSGGEGPGRHLRLQDVQEECLHGSHGTDLQDEVRLGGPHGSVAGQKAHGLGLRATEPESAERVSLHPRLQAGGREIPRGEGLHGACQRGEDQAGQGRRTPGHTAGEEGPGASRGPTVESVTRVEGGLYVHDIETTTENFYHNGVLSHNCYVDAGVYGGRASGLMSVPLGYGDYVAKEIGKMRRAAPFYLSSFTDPFLPGLENFYHNTENAMRAIDRAGLPMFTLSRVAYPDFAYELLAKNPHSYAQKSINTPDEQDWKKLSPGAISLAEHFAEITELRRRGIFVSIQVNPIIAGITSHEDVEALVEMLAAAGANHVIFKFVETSQPMAGAMVAKTTERFGDNRAAAFRELFIENNCGSQKTIVEEYRREGFRRYTAAATRCGMTAALCYEYGRDPTHPTGWRSIGPEYKTTPNCHGPSSVMYTRNRTVSDSGKPIMFREVAECPPSGCLSCASGNGGAPRCGNPERGAAKAMVLKDLREPVR